MKTISRYIMTLALLLTAVTGAWATEITSLKVGDVLHVGDVINTGTNYTVCEAYLDAGIQPATVVRANIGIDDITESETGAYYLIKGNNDFYYGAIIDEGYDGGYWPVTDTSDGITVTALTPGDYGYTELTFAVHEGTAETPVTVEWNASAKTGTFSMPGSDVVLTPIYAKAAAFATTGSGSEAKTQLPEAAEGVIAGTDDPLIKKGTGIVAFAGESTEVTQGTLMYAVTPATVTEAPALDAANKWSATVPTAETVADDGADVHVWYYIQGADAPEGDAATLDNTFSDTEPACLTVQVLSNKFDIQLNAANANTIEAGKATVTVGDQPATVTDGKLQGVKMGSEVKLEAKPGYKFRKVEVKKKEAETLPALSITSPSVGQLIGNDGKNYNYGAVPTGVTAVAKICYVSGSNGLALALTDEEGEMDWSTAQTTCAAHTPAFTGGTWKLASMDEWKNMISAIGSYDDLRDGFSSVGGTNLSEAYWSSTESGSDFAWFYDFDGGYWDDNARNGGLYVRACLAF